MDKNGNPECIKRSPFNFVSQITESLFGIGKKEAIDKVKQDQDVLASQTRRSFGKINNKLGTLESLVELQDNTLHRASEALKAQQAQLEEVVNRIVQVQSGIAYYQQEQVRHTEVIYNLV